MAQSLKNIMGAGMGAESGKLIVGTVADGLVATGTTQTDALQLTGDVNVAVVVTSGAGVVLPPVPQPGDEILITNLGANALNVYPGAGGSVQGGITNAPYVLLPAATAAFLARTGSKNWIVLSSGGTPPVVAPTLGALTFSGTAFTVGVASSGTIIGATVASTITATGLPAGLTISGVARTWAWDGTGTAASASFTLTETLIAASNSPHNSTISYAINSGSGLSAPTLGYPSPIASNPATLAVHIPVDWQSGDVLKLARSASSAMTSPTVLTHTLTDTDITNGTFSIGLSGVTLAGVTYFQAYGSHAGADSTNVSSIVAWGDTTAPVITTAATLSTTEQTQIAITLTATDTGGVPALVSDGASPGWYISGGADRLQFQIAIVAGVPTLQLYNNGTETYLSPANNPPNAANPYNVQITAVDYSGNQSTPLSEAVTFTQIDTNPDAYSLTPVTNASLSTVYTSNTVTVSGLQAGFNIASSLSGTGYTYSKNGGAYQAAGSFTVQNGDTITLRVTSPSANNLSETGVLSIGLGINATQSWVVSTPVTTNGYSGTDKQSTVTVSNPNSVGYLTAANGGAGGSPQDIRAVNSYSSGKHAVRFHIDVAGVWVGIIDGTQSMTTATYPSANFGLAHDGSFFAGSTTITNFGARIANDTVDVAFDMTARKAWLAINGTWQSFGGNGGDPNASGLGWDISALAATLFPFSVVQGASAQVTLQAVSIANFTTVI